MLGVGFLLGNMGSGPRQINYYTFEGFRVGKVMLSCHVGPALCLEIGDSGGLSKHTCFPA